MSKNPELKRISLMIREDQYQLISKKDLNLSGLLRDLLDDYFSEHTITLSVEEDTKEIYEMIISNTASTDADLEKHLRVSLKNLLKEKIEYMTQIHNQL
ncbi:MAG: hypothetical protein CME63_07195 [Halobacteriovoraceae bacterium]|nr:hypothetical protein [Halobacteriovoraceae bacterium]MBC97518.1 hypothetical protein [Halobacteriovoraceae bacterium]|tara:strand:- start:57921 stop:58217 length:297 start_codon:yes stop_codon:yes gene_type:complete